MVKGAAPLVEGAQPLQPPFKREWDGGTHALLSNNEGVTNNGNDVPDSLYKKSLLQHYI